MSFRIGIVGAGGIGSLHAETAIKVGLEVGAVCDVDADRARALAARYPGAVATTSIAELLKRSEIAAVVVATPNVHHKKMALAVIGAGKDLLLEKPMALSAVECDDIIGAIRETGALVQLGFVSRCAPASIAARELVTEGRFGRIYHAKASQYRQRGIPGLGRWCTTRALSGGGVLMDLGVHLLDLVLWLTDFPTATRASSICSSTFGSPIPRYRFSEMWAGPPNPDGVFDVEDAVTALVRFSGNMTMELNATWAADIPARWARNGVLLLGEKGGCYFDVWGNQLFVTTEQGDPLDDQEQTLPTCDPWSVAWEEQYRRFLGMVTERSEPHATAVQGRTVQRLVDALYRSAEEDREVEVV